MPGILIPEFPNYYMFHDGTVRSAITNNILSTYKDNLGYEQVVLYKDGKRVHKRVHRLMVGTWLKPDPNNPIVHHKNHNKMDNSFMNLELTNNSKNVQEGYDNNRYPESRKIGVRVKDKITGEIYDEFNSIRKCADCLGINRKTLSSILHGEKPNNYYYDFEII